MRELSDQEIPAFLQLLQDRSDPETYEMVNAQLQAMDMAMLERVRGHAVQASDGVLMMIDELLHVRSWEAMPAELERIFAESDEVLLESLIMLARFGHADCDGGAIRREIDRLGAACLSAAHKVDGMVPKMEALVRVLAREERFTGNEVTFYAADNSYMDSVLKSRQGIPISLAAIYILMGERLNLPVRGVGLPGHFILGLFGEESGPVLYDPFYGGKRLDLEQCKHLVNQAGFAFEGRFLEPVGNRYIVQRMLNNLLVIYTRQEDVARIAAIQRLAAVMA